jgi:P-type Ca2+ transporter type 2C
MTKQFYRSNIEEVAADLKTELNSGLSSEEASIRLNEYGLNELGETKHTSLAVKFLCQFKSFMIIVLIIAGIISGVVGYMNGEGFTDAIIILAIVLLNAVIGVVQEAKAEKSLDALKKMSAPHCKVFRDGKLQILESRYLVPGDIVEIETGDSVPADIRLTEAVNLKIQEAALTGESLPVEKNIEALAQEVPLGDRNDMAFQSCSVTYGRGRGIVTGTGTSTEVGRIASLLQAVPELKTPLQIRLDHLGKFLAWTSLGVCVLLFAIGLAYGHELLTMFMTAVSLAAAAIPEGLPAVSTIVLAVGVQRLAKRNAIVRNMPSVETLGSTTVICSDKTGTLTQNRMTVVRRFPENSNEVLKIAVLCNDGSISEDGRAIGDPTETALLEISSAPNKTELETKFPRVAEIPFDSERKLMTTIHLYPNGSYIVATKGGFDELLSRCSSIRLDAASRPISDSSSTSRPITESDHAALLEVNTSMATDALRVLCMAYKLVPAAAEITDILTSAESKLTFAGMVGMIDPPRLEVRDAVTKCGQAGIRPVMITGDHKITAMAIARDLGIMQDGDSAYTGAEVEAMNEAQLKDAVRNASVFARVSPEHKLRIVKAFKDNGEIVAMTGDGVNDAPALKLADIGVAMGITGTDVAKEAADVVLTDDNFATIVSSVEEGRRIYDNVLKSVKFLLSTNFGEVMLLFTAVVLNLPSPLLPIHILWINLVSDSLPALALSFDTAEEGIMRRKPIDPKEGIVNRHFAVNSILRGLLIAGLSLGAYFIGMQTSLETAMTMAFAVVALSQISILFCVRAGHNAIIHNLFTNKYLWAAVIFVLTLMLGVLLIPAAQSVFHVVPLSGIHWLWIAAFSIFPAFLIETLKFINSRTNGKLERCASY